MSKDEEYARERAREQALVSRSPIWGIALAAAINSGQGIQGATKIADQALAAFDSRFVPPAGEGKGAEDE